MRPNYQRFWRTVTNDGKRFCELEGVRKVCQGPKDAHHYLYKAKIKLQLGRRHPYKLNAALTDVRNGVCLCRRHHDMVHQGMNPLVCPTPPHYAWFLVDHGLHDNRPRAYNATDLATIEELQEQTAIEFDKEET